LGEDVGEGTEYITLQTVPGGISGQEEIMEMEMDERTIREIEELLRQYKTGVRTALQTLAIIDNTLGTFEVNGGFEWTAKD